MTEDTALPFRFDGLSFARALPHLPGVYRYYNSAGKLLYVGKAKDLNKRVLSYFQKTPEDPRIAAMVGHVARAEFTVVPTEIDALVLENRLIKVEKPHYNIQLREGSGYPYLHLSTDKKVPQLRVHRGKRGKTGQYYGPFPSRESVYRSHDLLQKHFGLRTCTDTFFANRSRPCLEYQIGRCSAPCVGVISQEDYTRRVQDLMLFLEGKSEVLMEEMARRMAAASERLDFEAAAQWRDRISSLRHVQSKVSVEMGDNSFDAIGIAQGSGIASLSIVSVREGQIIGVKDLKLSPPWDTPDAAIMAQVIAQHYLDGDVPVPPEIIVQVLPDDHATLEAALSEKKKISIRSSVRTERRVQLDIASKNAQAGLDVALRSKHLWDQRWESLIKLLSLEQKPQRIECFDISHTMGQSTVASCVVFGPNGPTKSAYRRYNISGITPGDDYAAMRQAVDRRLRGNTPPPDLLLIDGGLGQVAQAVEIARGLGLTFPIVGVSKGPERRAGDEDLILDDGARSIHPGPASPALHLIQAVRDEAHRFAIEGHRKRRERAGTASVLEKIPNVGPARRQALLKAFGGIQGLKQANVDAIAQVPGIGKDLAEQIAIALRT